MKRTVVRSQINNIKDFDSVDENGCLKVGKEALDSLVLKFMADVDKRPTLDATQEQFRDLVRMLEFSTCLSEIILLSSIMHSIYTRKEMLTTWH